MIMVERIVIDNFSLLISLSLGSFAFQITTDSSDYIYEITFILSLGERSHAPPLMNIIHNLITTNYCFRVCNNDASKHYLFVCPL